MTTLNVRPAFYRPRGSELVVSGWQAATGDIYTLDASGLQYVLVAGARRALIMGERVEFVRAIDILTDYIEERERGIVSHVDLETGTVCILLEGFHNGLGDNTLMVTPHIDDETLTALGGSLPLKTVLSPPVSAAASVAATMALAGFMVLTAALDLLV